MLAVFGGYLKLGDSAAPPESYEVQNGPKDYNVYDGSNSKEMTKNVASPQMCVFLLI